MRRMGIHQRVAPYVPRNPHPLLPVPQVDQTEQARAAVVIGVEVKTRSGLSSPRCPLEDCLFHSPAVDPIEYILHSLAVDPTKEGCQQRIEDLRETNPVILTMKGIPSW